LRERYDFVLCARRLGSAALLPPSNSFLESLTREPQLLPFVSNSRKSPLFFLVFVFAFPVSATALFSAAVCPTFSARLSARNFRFLPAPFSSRVHPLFSHLALKRSMIRRPLDALLITFFLLLSPNLTAHGLLLEQVQIRGC